MDRDGGGENVGTIKFNNFFQPECEPTGEVPPPTYTTSNEREDEEEEEEELIRVNLGLSHPLFEAEKRTTMSEDALGEFEVPGRAT